MYKLPFILIVFFLTGTAAAQSHSFTGIVADSQLQPIESMVCLLQNPSDTSFVKSTLSDKTGVFEFTGLPNGIYKLILSHLNYEYNTFEVTISGRDLRSKQPYVLQAQTTNIEPVIVTAERPLVKVAEGKLIYNAPTILESKIVSNAFDLLRYLPHMTGTGDALQLVGANNFSILIDGKPSTLNKQQLIQTLKAMPASRVANIEIMYSAPPRYNVRGAAVNIVLKKENSSTDAPPLQGEISGNFDQAHRPGYGGRASLLYDTPNFTLDFTAAAKTGKTWDLIRMNFIHQFENHTYDISQEDRSLMTRSEYDLRLGLSRMFKNKGALSFTYTGNLERNSGTPTANTVFRREGIEYSRVASQIEGVTNAYLHNMRLNYSSEKSFSVGVDYTLFRDPRRQIYRDFDLISQIALTEYQLKTVQHINKVLVYANHSFDLGRDWKLDYGVKGSWSNNHNDYHYYEQAAGAVPDSISLILQREYNVSAYAGFSKKVSDRLSIQASFSGGMYRATIDLGDGTGQQTLWNKFEPLINANITYTPSERHTLQFSLSSDINYPPYWALSNTLVRMNAYSLGEGNPELKFSSTYNAQLIYVLRQKYILVGHYSYTPDYFAQLPYQSSESLSNIFKWVNMNYQTNYGLTVIVPFRWGKVWDSKVTMGVSRQIEKDDDFFDLRFRRTKNSFSVQMHNTFNICEKPNIKAELSGYYLSGALQGVFDIRQLGNVTAGMKWQTADQRIELAAQVQDIFRTTKYNLVVDYANQYSRMTDWPDTPFYQLIFTYRFGNYKKKQGPDIEMSRFKR